MVALLIAAGLGWLKLMPAPLLTRLCAGAASPGGFNNNKWNRETINVWRNAHLRRIHQAPPAEPDLWQAAGWNAGVLRIVPKRPRKWVSGRINLDTTIIAFVLGAVFLFFFARAAQKASAGVPSGLQNFVEWVVEFIDTSVRGSFTARNDMVAPLALTIFAWILLMNLMDLLPIDYLPLMAGTLRCAIPQGGSHHRSECHIRHVHRRVCSGDVLQHQDEGSGRICRRIDACSLSASLACRPTSSWKA